MVGALGVVDGLAVAAARGGVLAPVDRQPRREPGDLGQRGIAGRGIEIAAHDPGREPQMRVHGGGEFSGGHGLFHPPVVRGGPGDNGGEVAVLLGRGQLPAEYRTHTGAERRSEKSLAVHVVRASVRSHETQISVGAHPEDRTQRRPVARGGPADPSAFPLADVIGVDRGHPAGGAVDVRVHGLGQLLPGERAAGCRGRLDPQPGGAQTLIGCHDACPSSHSVAQCSGLNTVADSGAFPGLSPRGPGRGPFRCGRGPSTVGA